MSLKWALRQSQISRLWNVNSRLFPTSNDPYLVDGWQP
jgi:hypothetical protein